MGYAPKGYGQSVEAISDCLLRAFLGRVVLWAAFHAQHLNNAVGDRTDPGLPWPNLTVGLRDLNSLTTDQNARPYPKLRAFNLMTDMISPIAGFHRFA